MSLAAVITSDVPIDTKLYEKTFPFRWRGSIFQQVVPPAPSPLDNILKVFDKYSWWLIGISLLCSTVILCIIAQAEQSIGILKVWATPVPMNKVLRK